MKRASFGLLCVALTMAVTPAQEQGRNPRQLRGAAIEGLAASTGEDALKQFTETHLAPGYRESMTPGALREQLSAIRSACAGSDGILFQKLDPDTTRITFLQDERRTSVVFKLETGEPHRIVSLVLEPTERSAAPQPGVAPIDWESLSRRLDEEAAGGFSGTVLVMKGGAIVLHKGYGMANRERGIPNGTETIYAIGSTPIDFTRGAVLKLEEMGRLKTTDTIGTFLPDVPADKRTMTLEHLLSGASGLPDFHHIMGVDADYDLTWIDRRTAIGRILGQTLLFAPGKGRAHSHSAWVLLAAIVEIVARQPYGEFLRQQFFEPAGMTRTGLHEDAARFADAEFAVGYGRNAAGKLNIPKHWGRTSWLVMGSGGMQSTPGDLQRWMAAIREGKTLRPATAARYWSGGVLTGGDDRGFLVVYTEGPDNLVILFSNSHAGPNDGASGLANRLVDLVRQGQVPRFALGVEFRVEAGGVVTIARVVPGGAAERDGLRSGDVVVSANGTPMRDPIQPILEPPLREGKPMTFEIERDGARLSVTVKPDPRS